MGFLIDLSQCELLIVQLEVQKPAERCLLVEAPELIHSVVHCHPALFVESLCLFCAAEEQR